MQNDDSRSTPQNKSNKLTRRDFIAAASTAFVAPTIVPSSVFGANAPSNRINIAQIGCGNQSRADLPGMLRLADTRVVAVCDVNKASGGYARKEHFLGREPAQKRVNEHYAKKTRSGKYQGCDAYSDFRDVLAREDVDAVMITLPDHWHALATKKACEAGKDVYCQKPMSLTVHDGQQMIKAVRKHNRILQTGSQYRSNKVVRRMCELVRNGRIGKVKRVISIINGSGAGPEPGWKEMPVPAGFDYDMWLGPAPMAPYHIDRCLYRFRFHLDYSGGQVTNTGAHSTDIIQWALGMDGTGPVEFEHQPGVVWPPKGHLYTTAMKTDFRARYANGIEFICRTQDPGFGARIEGTEGWVQFSVNNMREVEASSDAIKNSVITAEEIHLPVSNNHYQNFIDSVKSRKDPIEPVEAGHSTASICHLGNIAMRLKRKLKWNPEKEQFIGDDEANQMLQRPYRQPWKI
ncbi:MAG: Gfo/Idh/MocA family oxidoreductase [Planctomycetes bacterium]|nr:Gfo/Idh/MocA family oxidoreductase [Planctomycetota bacterium]MCH9723712.1 Gfo/Idh/MocA family oxidoreductase [Planctomycetota bacterium]MCH9776024.1 Gfo/Idh/MocA family oxidoreductase [Planctomycetota bacterium]MCH9790198.1 Gfo/Idh/MocA family oxidoreductase [Planctomycetota bacterium]